MIGIGRLGRDAELRYGNDGTAVTNLSVAWNYGKKDQDGKRPTQWAEFSLWGERAEKLSPHLVRGTTIFAIVSDVRIESFDRRDGGQGSKLVGRVDQIEFAGSASDKPSGQQQPTAPAGRQEQGGYRASAPRTAPAPATRPAPAPSSGFEDMDDDIPF